MAGRRPGREGVQDQLRSAIRAVRELSDAMDDDAFRARPPDGGWSVAECIDHLNETARLYLPELTEAIADGREAGLLAPPGSSERTLLGRFIAWTQEPPPRFRMKTFAAIEPAAVDAPADAAETFEALHEELIVRINEAADLDRKKIRLRSVLDRRLKLSLGDWFHFLAAHARRHIWQAERVKEKLETAAPAGDAAEPEPPGDETPRPEEGLPGQQTPRPEPDPPGRQTPRPEP